MILVGFGLLASGFGADATRSAAQTAQTAQRILARLKPEAEGLKPA
jgi:hypothetical protein